MSMKKNRESNEVRLLELAGTDSLNRRNLID